MACIYNVNEYLFSYTFLKILTVLPVPPLSVRPSVEQDGARCDDDITYQLNTVLRINEDIRRSLVHIDCSLFLAHLSQGSVVSSLSCLFANTNNFVLRSSCFFNYSDKCINT
jgi:hypothetical protein